MPLRNSSRLLVAFVLAMLVVALVAALRWPVRTDRITPQATGERIDLNAAEAADLILLPGIGPGLAERIVAHRERHGPFRRVEQLADVHGIGARTIERVRPWVTCGAVEMPRTRPADLPSQTEAVEAEP